MKANPKIQTQGWTKKSSDTAQIRHFEETNDKRVSEAGNANKIKATS